MPVARAAVLAGGLAFMSCGSVTAALADSPSADPVIVPLDVTMEDASWLETTSVPEPSQEVHIAEPDAVLPAAVPQGDQALSGSKLTLLAVAPDFSIDAPVVVASPGSRTFAAPVRASGVRVETRSNGTREKGLRRAYKVNGSAIEFDIPVELDGDLVGKVPIRIGSDRNVSVQLAELLALLRDRMDPGLHTWLSSAYSVNSHITFDQLRSAGIDVRYDAANDIVIMLAN